MKSNINILPLRTWSEIPKYWDARPFTANYNKLHESELIADGWRDIVEPVLTDTQKRGSLVVLNDSVTYEIIDLTPQEIADREQAQEDSDQSADLFNTAKSDGNQMFDRFLVSIQRQFDNGNLTGGQALQCYNMLYLPLLPLKDGMFRIAQSSLNDIVPPTNAKVLAVLDMAKQKVNAYVNK
jgi:hypothetical protein